MTKNNLKQFKKTLELEDEILSISFSDTLPKNFKFYKDTACTALARAFINREILVFDTKKYRQLCPGANYFLKLSKINKQSAIETYVKKEQIFKNNMVCDKFIKTLPKFPPDLKNKYLVIKPFEISDQPSVIIFLVKPAQAGRIIGLANYDQYQKIELLPNQPTCLAFFAPLVTKKPHLNFLDYYDRYYQGKINNKNIWPETKMIISLGYKQFKTILNNLDKSPQGSFKPDLKPYRVDNI